MTRSSGSSDPSAGTWLGLGLGVLIIGFLRPLTNPDIFWHLSAGEFLLREGSIPKADFLSHTLARAPWVDFEWLAQGIYALTFRLGGFWGLLILKASLLGFAALALERGLSLQGALPPLRAAVLAALAAGIAITSDVRPDNISLALFSLELWALERLRRGSPLKDAGAWTAAWLVGFALWANCHAGFAIGLATLACQTLGAWVEGRDPRLHVRLLAASLAGSLLNPFGWRVYGVLWQHAEFSTELGQFIMEWHPASLASYHHWPFWLLLAGALGLALRPATRRSLGTGEWLALAGLAWAGLRHSRQVPFFVMACLASLPRAAEPLGAHGARRRGRNLASAAVLLLCAAYLLRFFPPSVRSFKASLFPEEAAAFLSRHEGALARLRLYNPWGWGGYLGHRLFPGYRVFMDGRYIFHELLIEDRQAMTRPASWGDFLKRRGIELALLQRKLPDVKVAKRSPDGRFAPEFRPYYLFFMPQEAWALVYWDDLSLVFARRDAAPREWLKEHEYRFLHPGDAAAIQRALSSGALQKNGLRDDICRHLGESGPDPEAQAILKTIGDDPSRCPGLGPVK